MTINKINDKLPKCESILWTWSKNSDELHPVKIRVTFNRKSKYYSAEHDGEKIFVSVTQWNVINDKKKALRGKNKDLKDAIELCKSEAVKAVGLTTSNGKKQFTFSAFEKHYVNKAITGGFIEAFDAYIKDLLDEGRVGTYVAYKNALSAFKVFRKERDLSPAEITVQLLKDFEAYLKKEKTSTTARGKEVTRSAGSTTVSMYMRAVKVVYNILADRNPELKQEYPFATKQNDRVRYHIPASSGSHKGDALSPEVLRAFIDIKTEPGTPEHDSKLYFLFSLFCQGINVRDIANLRYKDIDAAAIRFIREKTKRTVSKKTVIEVPLTPTIESIILELSTNDKFADNFVFPILSKSMNAVDQDKAIRQKIKIINKWIAYLCKENKILFSQPTAPDTVLHQC